MFYFKERPLPGWADSYAHELKDRFIFPLIRDTVSEGVQKGIFKELDDLQTEIIYLGISQFMHRHYEKMNDMEYAKRSITSVTKLLEKSLGCPKGSIKIIKD